MKIRAFLPQDAEETYLLFCDTVHKVNRADYSPEQLNAWADGKTDVNAWAATFAGKRAYVAEENGRIVGFGDIASDGYLDRLYVASDCIGRGVGSALCDVLEEPFAAVSVHASITARPFFEGRGYTVLRSNIVERKGVRLTNYIMIKNK